MAGTISRLWAAFVPTVVPKNEGALKFGVLGAANIAPLSLINPAKTHPDIVIQAVAARDITKAEAFAKKHNIPDVYGSYQQLLDDPKIDVVFVPLPNAYHYEWAARAVRAGKHVLVEKPACSNATEAEILFNLPELSQPGGPILLEAFHCRFYPSFAFFNTLFDSADVVHVATDSMVPWWGTSDGDINFNYKLSGGSIMAMGTYNFAALRQAFGAEPEECLSCETKAYTEGQQKGCDWEFEAKFRFPGGRIGEAKSTLKGPTFWTPSTIKVTTREVPVADSSLPAGQEKVRSRLATLHGFIHGIFWHRIDVKDTYIIRNTKTGEEIKKYTESKTHKAYSFKEAGGEFASLNGEAGWMSFRFQLEALVDKIRGRKPAVWIDGQDSVNQMKMIDMAYEKSGLGLRPTSEYR